jgi:hypothetical protein
MSKDQPMQDELSAITQWQHGSYGVELPDWYQPGDVEPELAEYQQSVDAD